MGQGWGSVFVCRVVFRVLRYRGCILVALSRHSHRRRAIGRVARESIDRFGVCATVVGVFGAAFGRICGGGAIKHVEGRVDTGGRVDEAFVITVVR